MQVLHWPGKGICMNFKNGAITLVTCFCFNSNIIMKIYIETFTGMGQIYNFDVESSMTIQQLKQLLIEEMQFNEDLQTMCLAFNESSLEDNEKTLSDYDIQDKSVLQLIANGRGDFGSIGAKFADVSNKNGLKKKEFSKAARWRITSPGLCLEGSCTNDHCEAHKQSVIMPIGYKRFDILVDSNETTTICPLCKKYVEPSTCSFNNCWWKYEGIKGKSPMKCSSDWQLADNAYNYFDQQASGMIVWKQLIFEAVKDKPKQ
jgi:hypothetical protein